MATPPSPVHVLGTIFQQICTNPGHFLLSKHTRSHICLTHTSLQFDYIMIFLHRALQATCAAYISPNLSLLHYITLPKQYRWGAHLPDIGCWAHRWANLYCNARPIVTSITHFYMSYCSLIDLSEGWKAVSAWLADRLVADSSPTKWSPLHLWAKCRIGKVCRSRSTFCLLCYTANQLDLCHLINGLHSKRSHISLSAESIVARIDHEGSKI